MEITLEQVELLRSKADVSYAQAKQALTYSGGNLLDALIYLEETGAIPTSPGTRYSTRGDAPPPPPDEPSPAAPPPRTRRGLRWFLRRARFWLLDNELEIWRRDKPVTAMPVLILLVLLIALPYFTLPALVVGLFLGFRYRFSGPDLDRAGLNSVMDTVADTAADVGRQVMDELRRQHERHTGTGGEDQEDGGHA